MTPKKHPLEIFKKHGAFTSYPSKGATRVSQSSGGSKGGGKVKKERVPLFGNGGGRGGAPGEWRLSLSLNTVLICVLVMVGISLGMYFLGYYKVLEKGAEPQLMDIWPKGQDPVTDQAPEAANPPQSFAEKEDNSVSSLRDQTVYGVQVGTWAEKRYTTAKEANTWLKKNGFDSKLYPLENSSEFIIIVGSFFKKDDPELMALCQNLRSINNYPFGDASPFKDSRIMPYQIE